MISSILFDFGGTLDADGLHWLDRFWVIYEKIGLGHLPKAQIKEAFYWADAQADLDPTMKKAGLREMMERHARWQFEKLGLRDAKREQEAADAFIRPAERILRRNRRVLENLSFAGLKLGVISNFYGNVEILCQEFGYGPYLQVVLDSAVVGLKKPDPKLFSFAVEKLGVVSPAEVAFVGDSFDRDMVPAKSLGMKTYWLLGDQHKTPSRPNEVDVILHSLEDLLNEYKPQPEKAS